MIQYQRYIFETEYANELSDERLKRLYNEFLNKIKSKKSQPNKNTVKNQEKVPGLESIEKYLLDDLAHILTFFMNQYHTKRQINELIEFLARVNEFIEHPENNENNQQFQILVQENLEQHTKMTELHGLYLIGGIILCATMLAVIIMSIPHTAPIAVAVAAIVAIIITTVSLAMNIGAFLTENYLTNAKRDLSKSQGATFFNHLTADPIREFLEIRSESDTKESLAQGMEKVENLLGKNPLELIRIMSSHKYLRANFSHYNLVEKMKIYYNSKNIEGNTEYLSKLELLYTEKCLPSLVEACVYNVYDLQRFLENSPPKYLENIKNALLNINDRVATIIENSGGVEWFSSDIVRLLDDKNRDLFLEIATSHTIALTRQQSATPQ